MNIVPIIGKGGAETFKNSVNTQIMSVFRSMSLKRKIVLLYLLIVFAPTSIVVAGVGNYFIKEARSNYLLTVQEALKQTSQSFSFKKQSYDLLAIRTASDGELIARLSRNYTERLEHLDTIRYVDRSFQGMSKYLPGIIDFRIYHDNDSLVQDGGILWKPEERLLIDQTEKSWYEQRRESNEPLLWQNAGEDKSKIIVSHKIFDTSGELCGLVYLLLDYNEIFAEAFRDPFGGAGEVYAVDQSERVLASSVRNDIGKPVTDTAIEPYLQAGEAANRIDGKWVLTDDSDPESKIMALLDIRQLEKKLRPTLIMVGIGGTLLVSTSVLLLLLILKQLVWRIDKLAARVGDISNGVFEAKVKTRNQDELGELEVLFNQMTGQLRRLVQEKTEAVLKEKEQAYRALQSQINPHFIYNTLGLIRWRALDSNDQVQVDLIDSMTTFYRKALNNHENVTSIQEEVEHVKAYLDIQQHRYPGRVKVEWEISSDVMNFYVPKIMLQPIVENCYLHGRIAQRKGATIRIEIFGFEDNVHFGIFDNGYGIESSKLEQIETGIYSGSGNGLGISNIRDRLFLYFGHRSRLMIESEQDRFTNISIVIPACSERPQIIRGDEHDTNIDRG